MFKITGITLIVIEGSAMQSAECFKITVQQELAVFNTSSEPSE